jgi:protein phosphatase
MEQLQLISAGRSDPGLVRLNNEDSAVEDLALGLLLLADGMGGHNAGEVASRLAVDAAHAQVRVLRSPEEIPADAATEGSLAECLRRAFVSAHRRVRQEALRHRDYAGMGTTLVGCLSDGERIGLACVGDSRIYRLRGDALTQLTRDHSLIQELIDRGLYGRDEAQRIINRNIVTRAIGIDAELTVDAREEPLVEDDLLLLCSDGLTDMVEDSRIRAILLRFGGDLERSAEQLVAAAKDSGGEDNITVLLARARRQVGERSWYRKMLV